MVLHCEENVLSCMQPSGTSPAGRGARHPRLDRMR
eukprot:COSAG06_NODE_68419_length_227_cov_14.632812_1_plen_34_part_10